MKKFFLISLLIICMSAKAQPPTRFYTKFGGNGDDVGYSAKPTLDRQYIVAGSTSSYGSGYTDMYLVKVDSMGFVIWGKEFGGFNNDVGKSVIQLPDSGYVIAGFTNSFGAGGYDAYLVRTDKNGNLIWQTTFGGTDWDFASDLVLAPDGNIVVVGNTSSFGAGNKDGVVLKYDLLGNLLWQKFYGGAQNEELRSVIKTNDNFLATVGYTESKNDINGDGYFLKLDLNGDTLFTMTYGGPYKDYANDVVQKNTNEYIMCGAETFSAGAKTHSSMYSIFPNGSFSWENNYYASTDDEDFLSLTNSYQLSYVTGYIRNVPVPSYKMQGNIFTAIHGGWKYIINSFGGIEDETFYSIEGTKDGGYLTVGSTLSFNSLGMDIFLMKEDSTLITYSSVVDIKKVSEIEKPLISYDNQVVHFNFQTEGIIESYEIIDLNGKKVTDAYTHSKKIDVNLSEFSDSIYIIRFKYSSGYLYQTKLIKR